MKSETSKAQAIRTFLAGNLMAEVFIKDERPLATDKRRNNAGKYEVCRMEDLCCLEIIRIHTLSRKISDFIKNLVLR